MNQFVLQADRDFQTAHTTDSQQHFKQIKFTQFQEQYYTTNWITQNYRFEWLYRIQFQESSYSKNSEQ